MSRRSALRSPRRGVQVLRRVLPVLLSAVMLTMFLTVPSAAADESGGQLVVGPSPCLGGVGWCPGSGPAPQPTSGDPALIDPAYLSPLGFGPLYQMLRPTKSAQKESLVAFEREAVSRVLVAHGLPDSDTAAVETWGRSEAEARLWAMIVAAIKTPTAKRTSDEQNVVDWLTSVVQRENDQSAFDAGLEYAKWAGLGAGAYSNLMATDPSESELADFLSAGPYNYGPGNSIKTRSSTSNEGYCTYVSPTQDTKHTYTANIYDGDLTSQDCYTPCTSILGCLPKTPPAGKFLEWGKYDQMNEVFSSGGQDFKANFAASAGSIAGYTMLVGLSAALLASEGVVAFVPAEAVVSSVFTWAGAYYDTGLLYAPTQALADAAAPLVSLADVAGVVGIVIAGLAMIASETVLVVTAADVPKDLAKSITAQHTPDLRKLLDNSKSASGLFALFALATMSPDDGQVIMTYPARPAMPTPSDHDTALTITPADGSAPTTTRDLRWLDMAGPAVLHGQVRIHHGWFVGSVLDLTTGRTTSAQTLSIGYTDWNGDARTASLVPDGSGGYLFSTVSRDARTGSSPADSCLLSGDCTLSKSIHYLAPSGAAQTATLTKATGPTPPHKPDAGCPPPVAGQLTFCNPTMTTVTTSPQIGQVGQPLSITAHVGTGRVVFANGSLSGAVDFTLQSADGGSDAPAVPDCSNVPIDSHGNATCTWTPTVAWSGSVTATFYAAEHSGYEDSHITQPVSVSTHSSTKTTVDAPTHAGLGDTITLTAAVINAYADDPAPAPSGGTVRFTRGGVTVCTTSLSGGMASCDLTVASAAPDITAVYLGDASHSWSSASRTITIPTGPVIVHLEAPTTFVKGRPARIDAWLTADGAPSTAFPNAGFAIGITLSGGAGRCDIEDSGGRGSCLLTPTATGTFTLRASNDGVFTSSDTDPYGLRQAAVDPVTESVDVVEPSQLSQTVTAAPSARPGQKLAVSGAGWKGNAAVAVVLYDPANAEVARSAVTTAADGSFPADATVTVPRGASGGQYLIVAADDAGYAARSPLLVAGSAVNHRLVLSSPTVEAGNRVTVTGSEWPHDAQVSVVLYDPGGAEVARVYATTDADGQLPSGVTLTVPAGASTGLYSVQAAGAVISELVPLAVNGPLAQHVSFGPGDGAVPDTAVRYGDTFIPTATSDSGLPVVISVMGACRRDASTGVVTMIAGSGTCTVTASQAGNGYYRQAQVERSVTAARASQEITFDPPDLGTVGTSADLSAAVTASSGMPVTVTVDTARSSPADACTVSGTTVTFAHVGTCVLDAEQPGSDDYAAADTVSGTVTVAAPTAGPVTTSTPTATTTQTTTQTTSATSGASSTAVSTSPSTTATAPPTTPTPVTTAPMTASTSATTTTPAVGTTSTSVTATSPATGPAAKRSATTAVTGGGWVTWPMAIPSPGTPVTVSVMSPRPGTVTFTPTDLAVLPPGYVPVGDSFVITAPTTTATDPLHLRFAVLASGIPTGADPTTLAVFRDGHTVTACAATRSTEADPDPCVASVRSAGGVTTVTVLSRHASTWSIGVRMPGPSTTTAPDHTSRATTGLGIGSDSTASGTVDSVGSGAGGSTTARSHDNDLASTGFPAGPALLAGAVLLLLGLGLTLNVRGRRQH